MGELTLVVGNKNYSSWSLRPWLLMKQFNLSFEEIRIPLYQEDSQAALERLSPSALVPVLVNGDLTVWDSLAICEYLDELYPDLSMWPRDRDTRAIARSVSAEMHSGFAAIRSHMPMNCRKTFPGKGLNPDTTAEIKRVTQIWRDCLNHYGQRYGQNGPMLFGDFSIADAMFAPVALRFTTYQVELDALSQSYVSTILNLPAMQEWILAGRQETEVLTDFEPY